jgi:SulP family sulfate permease
MPHNAFVPKIVTVLREGYDFRLFSNDLLAGLIVGFVAFPLSIAFAIASGVLPQQGLITAFVAGLLISLFSGSRVQIGGPTGAFVIIVYSIVQKHGYDGLALATLMAGGLLIVMGWMRLGDVIKYIPYPVTVGFTSGIALVIFTTQIPDFLGLSFKDVPESFLGKWVVYGRALGGADLSSFVVGLLTVLVIFLWPRVTKRVPGAFVAIIAMTLFVRWGHLPVETISTRFGVLSSRLSWPQLPVFSSEAVRSLFPSAVTIALLAGIESLLSAVVADGMLGTRHRSNMELIGQGVANVFSPLFGGIPATGAIARTATNIKNGGRTPVAGIVHSAVVLILFLFCGKWAGYIPLPALAGILIVVAYQMSEWRHFRKLLKCPRSDVLVLLLTFGLTVLVNLTVAIQVGVILAAFLFMHRMAEISQINLIEEVNGDESMSEYAGVPDGIEIFEINGPLFFGAVDKFRDAISSFKRLPQVLILRMSAVPAVDATAVSALERLLDSAEADGTRVIFAGVNKRVFKVLHRVGVVKRIGIEHILADVPLALAQAISLLGKTRT